MKEWLFSGIFFLILWLASFILLETAIRVFLPQYNPAGGVDFYYNPEGVPLGAKNYIGRMWKNTHDYDVAVRFNQYGLRDKKDLRDSTGKDIFVVGDSFSMGWGVAEEKRFSDLLGDILRVPVFNISVPGNFDDYDKLVGYARKNGATVKNLVIGVCMENDLFDYEMRAVDQEKSVAFLPNRAKYSRLQRLKNYLTVRSALYTAVTHVFHGNGPLRALAIRFGWIIPNFEGIDQHAYSEKVLVSSADRLARLARPFRTTVLVIPSRLLWVLDNRETESRIHARFIVLLKDRGLEVVDMRTYFEAGGDPLQYHFKGDGHWNEKGHAKAAEVLAARLQDRLTRGKPEAPLPRQGYLHHRSLAPASRRGL